MARMPVALGAWSGMLWLMIGASVAAQDGPSLGGPDPQPASRPATAASSERPEPPIIETPSDDPTPPESHRPAVLVPPSRPSSAAAPAGAIGHEGQVLVAYDLTPYTRGLSTAQSGYDAVVDWIFRKTGRQTWHGTVPALLYGDGRTLRVYHTPEVQARVAEIVERFVGQADKRMQFTVYVLQAPDPQWRRALLADLEPLARPRGDGQVWVLDRRHAAALVQRLHDSVLGKSRLVAPNGQEATVALTADRGFQDLVRGVGRRKDDRPALTWKPITAHLVTGAEIHLTGLWTADGQAVEAVVQVHSRQVASVADVRVERLGIGGKATVQVPEVVTAELRAEVLWPLEQVLLISTGLRPAARDHRAIMGLGGERFGEVLVLIEADPSDIGNPQAPAPGVSIGRDPRSRP